MSEPILYTVSCPKCPQNKPRVSTPTQVLVWTFGVAIALVFFPAEGLAQAAGVNPASPEVAPAFDILNLLRTGSVGATALALWWAKIKDGQYQTVQDARVADAKAVNEQLVKVVNENTQAMLKLTNAIEAQREQQREQHQRAG